MEVKLVCSNRHLKIEVGEDEFVVEYFSLSEDQNLLFELCGTEQFVSRVGLNAIKPLELCPYFYFKGELETILLSEGVKNEDELSQKSLELLHFFVSSLWFIKDNSANVDMMFTYVHDKSIVFSRTLNTQFSNAQGEYVDIVFTLEELERAKVYFLKMGSLIGAEIKKEESETRDVDGYRQGSYNKVIYNTQNRIDRALLFLTLARSKSYLPLKISFYISIYESLFTTDNVEVSHKVTERAALYLGGNVDRKTYNFKLIKRAYDIRSKFVHGQKFDKKYKTRDDLLDISLELDSITRELLLKIIMSDSEHFLKDDENLNLWFLSLLLKD